tara:strand:- start:269 stop:478 length:210 start_codon:yes stop_codon:yes gene_type:complete
MTRAKKAKSFIYTGALDAIEIHGPTHSYIFAKGEEVEVCGEDVAAIDAHPDINAGGSPAPAEPETSEEA